MLRGELEDLISHLTGNEHTWVDFKEDYPIDYQRDNSARADFIQDIAAMANTVDTEPSLDLRYLNEDERYILVGVDDNGDPVGASEDLGEYTSILAVDTSNPQNLIADYLQPTPDVDIYKFDESEPVFVVLVIKVTNSPPVTIHRNIENLKEGDIFIRDADRNRPATREDYQSFIQFHLEKEREYVTQGMRQVVGLEIDYLRELGQFEEAEEDEEAVMPVRFDEEEGLDLVPSLRDPLDVTSLARELNADITKWRRRPNYGCSKPELYEYYGASTSIDPDLEKLAFLTQAAWRHAHLGSFWVSQMDSYEMLLKTFDRIDLGSFRGGNALHLGKFLAVTMDEEVAEKFVEVVGMNTDYWGGYGSIVLRCARESEPNEVLSNAGTKHAEFIDSPGWNLEDMDREELLDIARQVASELEHLASEAPDITPTGLKGWLRNVEVYIGYREISFDIEFEEDLLAIFD